MLWKGTFPDGAVVSTHRFRDGGYSISYGQRALFHLSSSTELLSCAAADFDRLDWRRFLLDTGLWSASLIKGYEGLHAGAVEVDGKLIALVSASGGGKSTLCLEFLRRGGLLFSDDILALRSVNGKVLGFPGPPLMNIAVERASAADIPGDVLGRLGDELWVSIGRRSRNPLPLEAVVMLQRFPGSTTAINQVAATALHLLKAAAGNSLTGHRRSRFELYSDAAAQASVYELRADSAVTPSDLAKLARSAIGL